MFLAQSLAPHIQIHKKIAKHQRHEVLSLGFGERTMQCGSCICPQVSPVLLIALSHKSSSMLWSHIFKHFRVGGFEGFLLAEQNGYTDP